jgi:Lipase.
MFLGKYLQTEFGITMGRITGLDAAGPLFENCTEEVRIAKSDADFVDGIHTNGGDEREGFCGMHMAYGHADFYPNGGGRQTGCSTLDAQCHHMRATELFVDSIYDKSCEFQHCPSKVLVRK